jgi:hypothetical protein
MATVRMAAAFATWVEAVAAAAGAAGEAVLIPGIIIAVADAGAELLVAIGVAAAAYLDLLAVLAALDAALNQIAETAARTLRTPVDALSDDHPWYPPGNGVAPPASWQG